MDLEKFKYDKNCKYCVDNGKEQINEKKFINFSDKNFDDEQFFLLKNIYSVA